MKKLNLAIIGQGRSGGDIHGAYYRSKRNKYFNVRYVVDFDEELCHNARDLYPGCETFNDYRELFTKDDIDLVVNASYSEMHFGITKEILEHGLNVLVEKPMARNRYECETLIHIAKEKGVVLAPFQNTFYAPFYLDAVRLIKDGVLGEVKQISILYNSFARRWDWQTLQKKMGGSIYNTGPHPIGMALGFLDFDEELKVVYSRLDTAITSGDAEDYAKILITAPSKPLVDLEISAIDAYSPFNIKIQGTKGTYIATPSSFEYKYIADGENPVRQIIEKSLKNEDGKPMYCSEKLINHEAKGTYSGTAFDIGTEKVYEGVYQAITGEKELVVTPEIASKIIGIIEKVHADNPLPVKFW